MIASSPPPATRIARKFVRNSSIAPADALASWFASMMPTTHSGGTSEIAIATPGSVSETFRRLSANAPAAPLASATIRSESVGLIRPATWLLVVASTTTGLSTPIRYERPTVAATPDRDRQQAAPQVPQVARHHPQRRRHDRRHQRRHDHRPDHGRGGVGEHAARGDDHRQEQQHAEPEIGVPPTLPVEPQLVGELVEVLPADRSAVDQVPERARGSARPGLTSGES